MKSNKPEIGIIFIGIGKYIMFFDAFYDLCEKNFLHNCKKNYYLITDSNNSFKDLGDNITVIKEKDYGWPYNAMKKFEFFIKNKDVIGKDNSYIFYFNADALIISPITEEEFLPDKENGKKLICVKHSVHTHKIYDGLPFEKMKESTSYVSPEEFDNYMVSGIIGGRKYEFFKHFEEMDKLLKKDLNSNIIPVWHDESLFNSYVFKNKELFRILPRTFCFSIEDVYPTEEEEIKIAIRPKYEVGGRPFLRDRTGIESDYRFTDSECDFIEMFNPDDNIARERIRHKGNKMFFCKQLVEKEHKLLNNLLKKNTKKE